MHVQPGTLLLPCIFFLFVARRVFAGSELFQEKTTSDLPTYAETLTAETKHSQLDSIAFFEGSLDVGEENKDQSAAAATNATTKNPFETPRIRIGPLKKTPSLSARLQKVKLFLTALVCLGLLTAVLKVRAAPSKQDEDRIKEIKARLAKVKILLPAVERLALAVNSKESRRSLKRLTSVVRTTDSATQESDIKKLEASLRKALDALQKLHQATLLETGEVLKENSFVPELSTFGLSVKKAEDVLINLGEQAEAVATRPLARTYRSLLKHSAALPKRLRMIAEKLYSQPLIKDEEDTDALLSTTAAFEALRATSVSRQRVIEMGQRVGNFVFDSIKLKFIGFREHAMLDISGDLQMLQLRYALVRNAADAAKKLSDEKAESSLDALKEDITEVEGLMSQMRLNIETLQTCTTVPDASAVNGKSRLAERRARELLDKWFKSENWLSDCPETFDNETHLTLLNMAAYNAEFVQKENELLTEGLTKVKRFCRDKTDLSLRKPDVISKSLRGRIVEEAKTIAYRANVRKRDTAVMVESLKQVEERGEGLEELTQTSVNSLYQTMDRGKLDTLELAARLLRVLGGDVKHHMCQVDKLDSRMSSLSEKQIIQYKELQKQFETAKRDAHKAETLIEAAEAAAVMRDNVLAMEELFFPSDDE